MHAHRRHRPRRIVALARSLDRSGALLLLTAAGVVLAALLLVVTATPAHADTTRKLNGDYAVGGARRLEIGIPFGEIRVEGTDDSRVKVRVEASCDEDSECEEFMSDLRLESTNRGGTLRVKLEGTKFQETWNSDDDEEDSGDRDRGRRRHRADRRRDHDGDDHGHLTIVVEVPRSLQVELNMGAGEVNIAGLRHDLSVDLGAGEVNVRMMERHVASVDVKMAIGETT
ncbi:MAG TPA: hypothetical protein VFU59_11095, partial [Candidatus Eisenbacteria bacterium]|nr:hypothetical protein [Candidatus Eisenbacteria bacterium]